jgi:hypothetical protein
MSGRQNHETAGKRGRVGLKGVNVLPREEEPNSFLASVLRNFPMLIGEKNARR